MADWTKPLPGEAVEGADTHVEDHNKINAALTEIRTVVDGVEKEPGPPGDDGKDGAPSQEDWDALLARVQALEDAAEAPEG